MGRHIFRRKSLASLALICNMIGLANSALALGPISGQVLDQESHAPIAGAVVIASWSAPSMHGSYCSWVDLARTDARGYFEIAPAKLTLVERFGSAAPSLRPFKSGYATGSVANVNAGKQLFLTAVHTSVADRSLAIRQEVQASICTGAPVAQAARFLPLYKTLFTEANSLPQQQQDKLLLMQICEAILEVGSDFQGPVGHQRAYPPGMDPQSAAVFGRAEPRCVAVMTPTQPAIRSVILPNPSLGGAPAPTANPSH
jgi:hypothetical protein